MEIQKLRKDQLPEYLKLLHQVFPADEIETPEEINKFFDSWTVSTLVDEKKGIIGAVHWTIVKRASGQSFVAMDHVWVDPSFRGKGLAEALVNGVLEIIKAVAPSVDCAFDTIRDHGKNAVEAKGFWKKMGALRVDAPFLLPIHGTLLEGHFAAMLPLQPVSTPWSQDFYIDTVRTYLAAFFDGEVIETVLSKILQTCPTEVHLIPLTDK